MPAKDGIAACWEIAASLPETRVMVTASNKHSAILEAVNAGATGYLKKHLGNEMLLSTVRVVAAGEFRVQREAARRLVSGMRVGPRSGSAQRLGPSHGPGPGDTEGVRPRNDVC